MNGFRIAPAAIARCLGTTSLTATRITCAAFRVCLRWTQLAHSVVLEAIAYLPYPTALLGVHLMNTKLILAALALTVSLAACKKDEAATESTEAAAPAATEPAPADTAAPMETPPAEAPAADASTAPAEAATAAGEAAQETPPQQ